MTVPPKTGQEPLTSREVERLSELEQIVELGLQSAEAAGNALLEIRDSKLWKGKYKTREAYVKDRWGKSRSWAHRQMDFAEERKMLPDGNKPEIEAETRKRRVTGTKKGGKCKPGKVIANLDDATEDFRQLLMGWKSTLIEADFKQLCSALRRSLDELSEGRETV